MYVRRCDIMACDQPADWRCTYEVMETRITVALCDDHSECHSGMVLVEPIED